MPDADIGLYRRPFCSTTTSTSSRNTALLRADSLSSHSSRRVRGMQLPYSTIHGSVQQHHEPCTYGRRPHVLATVSYSAASSQLLDPGARGPFRTIVRYRRPPTSGASRWSATKTSSHGGSLSASPSSASTTPLAFNYCLSSSSASSTSSSSAASSRLDILLLWPGLTCHRASFGIRPIHAANTGSSWIKGRLIVMRPLYLHTILEGMQCSKYDRGSKLLDA